MKKKKITIQDRNFIISIGQNAKEAAKQSEGLSGKLESLGVNFQVLGTVAVTTFASVLAATRDWKKAFLYTLATTFATALTQIATNQLTSSTVSGMFGAGISGFGSSIGNWLKGLAPTPTGVGIVAPGAIGAGTAIGGEIKSMAVGGPSGRDRVFALLEPGEYVIRRPAAMAIGKRNLDHLNALGPNKFEIGGGLSDIGGGSYDAGVGSDYSPGSVTSEALGGFYSSTTDYMSTLANDMLSGPMQSSGSTLGDFISNAFVDSTIGRAVTGIMDVFSGTKSISEVVESVAAKAFDVERGGVTNMMSMGMPFGSGFVIGNLLDFIAGLPGEREYPSGDGRALGGLIKQMAIGGYASMRDRVPALLEPGEFVIRRPSAMAIGGDALNQMNATGKTPTNNVMVNVTNQGTPQQPTGKPVVTRQGENLVVDIVLRDMQNNGPIRRTMRGMR